MIDFDEQDAYVLGEDGIGPTDNDVCYCERFEP